MNAPCSKLQGITSAPPYFADIKEIFQVLFIPPKNSREFKFKVIVFDQKRPPEGLRNADKRLHADGVAALIQSLNFQEQ